MHLRKHSSHERAMVLFVSKVHPSTLSNLKYSVSKCMNVSLLVAKRRSLCVRAKGEGHASSQTQLTHERAMVLFVSKVHPSTLSSLKYSVSRCTNPSLLLAKNHSLRVRA